MSKNPVTEYVCSDCLEVCGDRVHQSPVLLDDQSILDKVKTLFPTQHRNVGKCARTRTHQWGSGFVNFLSTLSVGLGNDEIFWTSRRIEIMRVRSHELSTLSVGLGNDEIFWTSRRIEIMRVRSHVNMKFN